MRTTKAASVLDKENGALRVLLKRVLALDPAQINYGALTALQGQIRATIDEQDGRATRAGFANGEVQGRATATRAEKTAAFYAEHGSTLRRIVAEGLSYRAAAARLDAEGVPSPGGGKWAPGSVKHALDRLPPG